ncbi:hypothetical protein GCM10009737_06530 [Nocardioides lentus]|uniref:MFS transporter n=1 Tax=Nocardioides lentus TaxID=338077 RepID=A0ABN2P0H1_9ACTN
MDAATPTAARGTALGLVTAAGATWAHHAAGGTVGPGAFGLAVLVSVAAGLALTPTRGTSPLRVLALAAATQGAWHLLLATGPPTSHTGAAHGEPGPMLLAHLAVVVVTTALALGADRALLALAREALDRLRVPAPGHPSYDVTSVAPPAPTVGAPRPPAPGTAPVRGPPSTRALVPLAPAAA